MISRDYTINRFDIQNAIIKLCRATTNSGGISANDICDVFEQLTINREQTQQAIRVLMESGLIVPGYGLKLIIKE